MSMIYKFCVYLTKYSGDLLPANYIGSTSVKNAESGKYFGSVISKKWKDIFKLELKNNPQLFTLEILSKHSTREEAWIEELKLQKLNNVVKSNEYFNESYASVNGMFGRDTSGKNNPMFGTKRPEISKRMLTHNPTALREVREKISKSRMGIVSWNKGKKYLTSKSKYQYIKDLILLEAKSQIVSVIEISKIHNLNKNHVKKSFESLINCDLIHRVERGKYSLKNI